MDTQTGLKIPRESSQLDHKLYFFADNSSSTYLERHNIVTIKIFLLEWKDKFNQNVFPGRNQKLTDLHSKLMTFPP